MLPEGTGLEGLVLESGLLKRMTADLWAGRLLRYLDAAVLEPRDRHGVNWPEYAGGGERRLAAGQWVHSVSDYCRGFLCWGLKDGSIRVWSRATLEVERTLTGHTDAITTLVLAEMANLMIVRPGCGTWRRGAAKGRWRATRRELCAWRLSGVDW